MTALAPTGAAAQSHEKVNKADNPLTPTIGLNLQDHWTPRLHGSDEYTNAFLHLRRAVDKLWNVRPVAALVQNHVATLRAFHPARLR